MIARARGVIFFVCFVFLFTCFYVLKVMVKLLNLELT